MEHLESIRNELRRFVEGKVPYEAMRGWLVDVYAECVGAGVESPELSFCRSAEWECAKYSEGFADEPQLRINLALCMLRALPPM